MGSLLLILALTFSLLIAIIALANQQPVMANYLFGQAEVSLIVLILGSAIAGAFTMGLFSLFRSIRTAFGSRGERRQREELQRMIDALQNEKNLLQAELYRVSNRAEEENQHEGSEEPGLPVEGESQPEKP